MPSGRFRVGRFLFGAVLLSLAAYLIWDRIEAAALSREIAQIAQRGEPVHYGDGYPQPRTVEQREASRLYTQAAGLAQEQSAEDNHRASRIDVERPVTVEMILPEIVAAYRDDAPALQLLDRVTPLDFGGFDPADGQSDYPQGLGALGALACLRADLASVRGDGDAAAVALVPGVSLQRTLHPRVYRTGHAARLLGSLRILFRRTQPSDASLARLQRAFETWPDEDPTLRSLLQDRAQFIDMSAGDMRGVLPPSIRILGHPFVMRSARRGLASFEPLIAIARQPWATRWGALADLARLDSRMAPPNRRGFVARLLDPFPFGYIGLGLTQSAEELATRRVAVAAIAVERFRRAHAGALPASLDALGPTLTAAAAQDPFSGNPLVYQRGADDYVIYSFGWNRRDDGGAVYGYGSAVRGLVASGSARDLGIRVPLLPQQ
jgi:hypothetical protein